MAAEHTITRTRGNLLGRKRRRYEGEMDCQSQCPQTCHPPCFSTDRWSNWLASPNWLISPDWYVVTLGESPNICTHPESSQRDEQLPRTTLPLLMAQLRAASQRKKDWLHQSAPTQRMDVFLNSATCQRPASIHARTWQGLKCNKNLWQCLENACVAI